MTDPATQRAEQIREATGLPWELACQQAEQERDSYVPEPISEEDSRALLAGAVQYYTRLADAYADHPGPHATRDNARRLAALAAYRALKVVPS